MKVTPIQTQVVHAGDDLYKIITQNIHKITERSILCVTSKIVALCEKSVKPVVEHTKAEKFELVQQEADFYLDPSGNQYQLMITIRDSVLAVNAGIDESNADHQYVLLPRDSYRSAADIWAFVRSHYGVKELGVIITDSRSFPLKWGTIGTAVGWCGFSPLNDLRGTKDLFGYQMRMTQVSVAEALAVAAVVEMGETNEAQPLVVIEDAKMVKFTDQPPTSQAIQDYLIEPAEDAYGSIITLADWKKGKRSPTT